MSSEVSSHVHHICRTAGLQNFFETYGKYAYCLDHLFIRIPAAYPCQGSSGVSQATQG